MAIAYYRSNREEIEGQPDGCEEKKEHGVYLIHFTPS